MVNVTQLCLFGQSYQERQNNIQTISTKDNCRLNYTVVHGDEKHQSDNYSTSLLWEMIGGGNTVNQYQREYKFQRS